MILLTFSVAVLDEHTRLARLETSAPLPTLGTAVDRRVVPIVHGVRGRHGWCVPMTRRETPIFVLTISQF